MSYISVLQNDVIEVLIGRMIENPDTMILSCKVQRYKKEY